VVRTSKNALSILVLSAFFFAAKQAGAQPPSNPDCSPPGSGQLVTVKHVYDGDTVRLKDGRRVRLGGINTPELSRDGGVNERYAVEAKQAVEKYLARSEKVFLYTDKETTDHYGRFLGHLFKKLPSQDWQSLEKELLQQGLAYHIAKPPNLRLAACFAVAESIARANGLGMWRHDNDTLFTSVENVIQGGYQRIRGKVRGVNLAKAWWINFSDNFAAVIYSENHHYFDPTTVEAWPGKWLEVEGWVYKASYRGKPQWRVKLDTSYAVSEINGDYQVLEN
jgi:endonuclease YncB( thermonuclease family)